MKKISGLIILLFCAFFTFAQSPSFPNQNLNNSNSSTIFGYLGGLTSNGYKLKYFVDTTAANAAPYLKFTPHLMIKGGNNIYIRSTDISRWLLVGGSSTITFPITFIGIDSVTVNNNILCQWSGGFSTCYTINTTNDTTITGIDSVTVVGSNLCQWKAGVSVCYTVSNTIIDNSQINNIVNNLITQNNYSTFGIDSTTRLITGSVVIDSGLVGHNTDLYYKILGRFYNADYSPFTIDPSVGNDRKITIVADTLGNVYVKYGSYGNPASDPIIDAESECPLVTYTVRAGVDTVVGVSNVWVYREAVEWQLIRGTISTGFDSAYIQNPYAGLLSLRIPSQISGQYYEITDGLTHNRADYTILDFYLRLNSAFNKNTKWGFTFFMDSSLVTSNTVVLTDGQFGYDRTVSAAYQAVAIPFNQFDFTGPTFNKIRITNLGNGSIPYQIDDMKIQAGGGNIGGGGNTTVNNVPGPNIILKIGNILRLTPDSTYYELVDSLSGQVLRFVPTFLKYLVSQDTCIVLDSIDAKHVGIALNPYCRGGGSSSGITKLGTGQYGLIDVNDSTYRADSTVLASKTYAAALAALKADKTITLTANAPLTGGGDLSANRSFGVDTSTTNTGLATLYQNSLKQNSITIIDSTQIASALQSVFVFPSVPSAYEDFEIKRNGGSLEKITDYTKSGNTITLTFTVDAGDLIRYYKRK